MPRHHRSVEEYELELRRSSLPLCQGNMRALSNAVPLPVYQSSIPACDPTSSKADLVKVNYRA